MAALGAHGELAAARAVGFFDAALAVDETAGGKIGAGNERQHFVNGSRGLVQQQEGGSMISVRLWGGILVAMPTAIPFRSIDQ